MRSNAKNETVRKMVSVRAEDHQALMLQRRDLPVSMMDLFTAMRLNWESTSPERRMAHIRRVGQLRPKPTSAA